MKKRKSKILYRNLAMKWLEKRENFVKESTYANYACIIYNHLIPEIGDIPLIKINNEILQDLIIKKSKDGKLNNKGKLSNKSVRDIISVLKSTIRYAINNNYMDIINLNFYYPYDNNKNKIYALTKNEQKKIIDYCMNSKSERNLGIILSLYTGIRIGELCALKWEDINFKKNYIVINKTLQRVYLKDKYGYGTTKITITSPKTKNADRIVPLNSDFINYLKQFQKSDENYIITGKIKYIEPRTFRKHFYKVMKILDIDKVTFHSLRHTFASNCIRLGCDYKTVSELLGHSSINITLNIYVHSEFLQKKKCINTVYKDLA